MITKALDMHDVEELIDNREQQIFSRDMPVAFSLTTFAATVMGLQREFQRAGSALVDPQLWEKIAPLDAGGVLLASLFAGGVAAYGTFVVRALIIDRQEDLLSKEVRRAVRNQWPTGNNDTNGCFKSNHTLG